MPAYIEEKLIEIEGHAKRLLDQESADRDTLRQEYVYILQCIDAIKIELKKLGKI
jgi:hypothetical protein